MRMHRHRSRRSFRATTPRRRWCTKDTRPHTISTRSPGSIAMRKFSKTPAPEILDQDFPQRLQKRPSRIQSRLQSAQTDRSTQQTPFVALYDDGRQRDDLLFQLKMGILFGNETKKCPECGMIIPSEARKCPYCRTEFGEPSLSDDLNRFGCLGYPSVILTILLLLHTCS